MATYTWGPVLSADNYQLDRKVGDADWVAIVTIANDTGGANYNSATGLFFYEDLATVAGEVIRIRAEDGGLFGPASYVFPVADAPQTCTVFGTVVHAVSGEVMRNAEVRLTPHSRRRTVVQPNSAVASIGEGSVVGGRRTFRVFSNDEGQWQASIPAGVTVGIEIPQTGYAIEIVVPEDRDLLNIADAHIYRAGTSPGGLRTSSTYHRW